MAKHIRMRRRQDYFFAEAAAGMYDLTIGMVVPRYDLMHEFLLYLLKQHHLRRGDVVLDVGSGTGVDSIAIQTTFRDVRVISLDLCTPIQEVHHRKLGEEDTPTLQLRERSMLVCSDVMKYASGAELLQSTSEKPFAAIVTSLTVHHLEHLEKRRFYRMMYEALSPGGCFINADLFSYTDPTMTRDALRFDLAWMRREFTAPESSAAKAVTAGRRRQMLKKWIDHYDNSNRLEPLEDGGRKVGQLSMIRKAGFQRAVVPYRLSLSGIILAEK
jgi:cyclopropane fatty-acyl-phospholipid synthase-like methyltransferase